MQSDAVLSAAEAAGLQQELQRVQKQLDMLRGEMKLLRSERQVSANVCVFLLLRLSIALLGQAAGCAHSNRFWIVSLLDEK